MRFLFAFALLAFTGVRAQNVERIFIDGKGVPNLAAATGSSTTTTDLIQAALTGSGSILSQFANNANNYQNVDANTFSIKPTVAPPLAATSSTTSPTSPAPATAGAPAPEQEITLTGFSVPELSSSVSSNPSTVTPSTTSTTLDTTTTTTAPTATTTTTAAPTTTTTTTAAPTTTTTTTAAPTTTATTTAAPTTTMTTTAAPTTTMTTTAAPTTTMTTTAAPTTTTTTTAAPTTTTTTTTAPTMTTATTTAPATTTTSVATTSPSPATNAALSSATLSTENSTVGETTNSTTSDEETTTADAPEGTEASAGTAATSSPPQTATSVNADKDFTPTIVVTGTVAPTATSTEALIAITEVPGTTTPSMATSPVLTTETVTGPIITTAIPTPSQTTSGSSSPVGTAGILSITEGAAVLHPSPNMETNEDSTLTAPAVPTDIDSGVTESISFTPAAETEAPEASPSFDEESAEGSSLIGVPVNEDNSSSASDSTSRKAGPGSKPKKPIFASATGSVTATAVFSGNGSVIVSAAVNKDPNKETETVTVAVTPGPENSDEVLSDEAMWTEESAEFSPESQIEAETHGHLIPKSPGRPPEEPSPTEDAKDIIDDSVGAEESSGSADPKTLTFEDPQDLANNVSTENATSPESEGITLPESSSQPQVSITSNLGSMLNSLPSSKEKPTPEPSIESVEGAEVFPFSALADSLSSSFGNGNNVGPLPFPSTEAEFGAEELEDSETLEATFGPFDGSNLLKSIESGMWASDEPEISSEPEMSEEPEMSTEPEASTEELLPSGELEDLEVDLIVKHPTSLEAKVVSEEIKLISNELTFPMQWMEVGLFLVSNLSKFGSAVSVVRQADEPGTFELTLQSTCFDSLGCESEMWTYKEFIRDGRMDETLAARDMRGVNVYLKGDLIDRSVPEEVDAVVSNGLNGGIIAGIAIGAVAAVSLLVYGIVFVAKRGPGSNDHHDAESGRIQSDDSEEDRTSDTAYYREEEGSFMISNFGGSPRNTEALIPWMSNSSEGTGGHLEEGSSSFISVDTAVTEEIETNHLSNYRFEETTSSGSDSDFDDLEVDDHNAV